MSGTVLPRLVWHGTPNQGNRAGHPIELVVVHRWGVRLTTETAEASSYHGTVNWLSNPASNVSAHLVYPGSAVTPDEATQMVDWQHYAWAEAAYNPVAVEVESADAIWIPYPTGKRDDAGMATLARIVAFLLASGGGLHDPKTRTLPPVWSTAKGFCRHADLGAAGGGHTSCPTTDIGLWRHFVSLVQAEYARAGFRPVWGWASAPQV